MEITTYNKAVIYILFAILIIALYFTYINFFAKGNIKPQLPQTDTLGPTNTTPPQCSPEPIENTILADYYIASSANTLNTGQYKYGYLSLTMLEKALSRGARYIEIEICRETPTAGSLPVVAIGEKRGNWIYSLNTLSPADVFATAVRMGFIHKPAYPLFINLKLHTDDPITLDELYNVIVASCESKLLSPRKYMQTSLAMEYLCNLRDKIIIFSFNSFKDSKLADILIPTTNVFKYISPAELNDQPLSTAKEEQRAATAFNKLFHARKDITPQTDIMQILAANNITDQITNHNKIALGIMAPEPNSNYDAIEIIKYGIQFVAFNYHIPDSADAPPYAQIYAELFKDDSFILKPSGLRMLRRQKSPPSTEEVITNNRIYNNNYIDLLRKHEFASFNTAKAYIIRNQAGKLLTADSKHRIGFRTVSRPKLANCFLMTKIRIPDNDIYIPLFAMKSANYGQEQYYLMRTTSTFKLSRTIGNIRDIALVPLKSPASSTATILATIPAKPYSMDDNTIKILFHDGNNMREREFYNGDDALLAKASFTMEVADVVEYANIKAHDGAYFRIKENSLGFTYDAEEATGFVIQRNDTADSAATTIYKIYRI